MPIKDMRDSSFIWGNPIKRSTRVAGVVCAILVLVAMAVLLVFVADLNTEIQHANQRADAERQCAKALEAWVHQQVAPDNPSNLDSLVSVKDKACKAHMRM
ncbi:MAG: hypothetical protein B7Y32_01320 [Methylophilales bacterium 16-45-7]|jgi:predicted PurR-regulated permease PerM|nr:MAG: hypothetical protein B7Y32_01320 [Methylophilales bacterium 16-45-7]